MSDQAPPSNKYDVVAPRWGDKMRALGYYDAYVEFLSTSEQTTPQDLSVIDVGAGTASFAEAWITTNGPPKELTLLDPSLGMLQRGQAVLRARGIEPRLIQAFLGEKELQKADAVLAAHVIEHCADPLTALRQLHDLLRQGGRLHLVVSKPHWCNAIIWFQWRHRTFGKGEILNLLRDAGFDIERVFDFPSGPPSRTSRGILAIRSN